MINYFRNLFNTKTLRHNLLLNVRFVSTKIQFKSDYLLLIIPITTFGLGSWQIHRRRWKLQLIDSIEKRIHESPIDLPLDLDQIKELEYRRVKVRGKFDNSKEMYLFPRSLVKSSNDHRGSGGGGSIFSQRTDIGSWVITPFILEDSDVRILVNRGWVQQKKVDPKRRIEGQTNDEIELTGVVRLTEKRQPFGANNDPNSNSWHHRDVEGFAKMLNTVPIFIDADYHSTISGGPIGGQTRVTLRNEHLSYIITWYGLCIITSYIWFKKFHMKKLYI